MDITSPRIALVGVAYGDAKEVCGSIEAILADFPDAVVARLKLPQCALGTGLLTLVLNASTDQIGALAGRLGMVKSVRVKSMVL